MLALEPQPRRLPWTARSLLALGAVHRGVTLAVLVDPETRSVMALETPEHATVGPARAIFDNHKHDVVSEGERELCDAMALAERYVAAWLSGDAKRIEECRCTSIKSGPRARTKKALNKSLRRP